MHLNQFFNQFLIHSYTPIMGYKAPVLCNQDASLEKLQFYDRYLAWNKEAGYPLFIPRAPSRISHSDLAVQP